jgi:hypothetical protein
MWDRSADGRWVLRRDRHGRPVLQKNQPPEILFRDQRTVPAERLNQQVG